MKLAFLANAANRHTHRWAAFMAQRGHTVRIFSDETPGAHLDYSNIRLVPPKWSIVRLAIHFRLGSSPYANNREKWHAYKRSIAEFAPDLLHAHEALAYGPMLAHFPQYPRVLTPWGADVESLRGNDEQRKELVLSAMRAAHVVTTNAPGCELAWAKLADISHDRLSNFSWGVDLDVFRPRDGNEQLAIRDVFGVPADAPFFLSPRLARSQKDADLLFTAWKLVANSLRKHHLVILRAGTPSELWAYYREHAARTERVHLIDADLTPHEMATAYTAALATLSLLDRDLLALSILESLACGGYLILSNLPIYEDNLNEAHKLTLASHTPQALADALSQAASFSSAERQRLGDANRLFAARHHDWRRQAPNMELAYALAIQRHEQE